MKDNYNKTHPSHDSKYLRVLTLKENNFATTMIQTRNPPVNTDNSPCADRHMSSSRKTKSKSLVEYTNFTLQGCQINLEVATSFNQLEVKHNNNKMEP